MKKQNIWILVGIVVVIIVALNPQNIMFEITGNEYMTRSVPSTIDLDSPGDTFMIDYNAHNVQQDWGVSIVDEVTGGCSWVDASNPLRMVLTNDKQQSVQLSVPNKDITECTFSGNYKFGEQSKENFDDVTVDVRFSTCIDSDPSGADLYINGELTATTGYCAYWIEEGDNIRLEREGYKSKEDTISADEYGSDLSYTLELLPQCDSNYDSNNDGTISRTELGSAITDWINEDLTRNKLGIAIQEWANGC